MRELCDYTSRINSDANSANHQSSKGTLRAQRTKDWNSVLRTPLAWTAHNFQANSAQLGLSAHKRFAPAVQNRAQLYRVARHTREPLQFAKFRVLRTQERAAGENLKFNARFQMISMSNAKPRKHKHLEPSHSREIEQTDKQYQTSIPLPRACTKNKNSGGLLGE